MVSELHGRYYEQTYRGNVFSLCTQGTGVTTTAALATTWTGLAVANPAGSGVNLVLLGFTCAQFAVGAAATVGIMGGAGAITSTLTPQSRLIGSGLVSKANGSAGADDLDAGPHRHVRRSRIARDHRLRPPGRDLGGPRRLGHRSAGLVRRELHRDRDHQRAAVLVRCGKKYRSKGVVAYAATSPSGR
jgi:hypothetical protein